MSSCLFGQSLPVFTISSRSSLKHAWKSAPFAMNYTLLHEIDGTGTCNRRVRKSLEEGHVGLVIEAPSDEESRRERSWNGPNITRSSVCLHNQHFPFLALSLSSFLEPVKELRLLAIAAIHESTMKRPYDSACMCVMFYIRFDDIALACSFYAVRIKSTAWSVARDNKSTYCRLTDSKQTREWRGTSL